MDKVRLKRVHITDKKKDGSPLKDRKGRGYWRVAIQTEDHGETWLSSFVFRPDDPRLKWKQGDEVAIQITQTDEGYWNYDIATREDFLEERIGKVEQIQINLYDEVQRLKQLIGAKKRSDRPDVPF